MKRAIGVAGIVWFLLSGVCSAQAPRGIAGFVLGQPIDSYMHLVDMNTDMPIRYLESLHEVAIKPMTGFKTGLLSYGTCTQGAPVLRIKLKYADSSKKFYDRLLKEFKARFGEPNEWRGDPFHIVIDWKWSFTDEDNNRISLSLQHNTKDEEEKLGNSVKMNLVSGIEAERRCFDRKTGEASKGKTPAPSGIIDWERMVPR